VRIGVLGAGGVGSYYGGLLARRGHRVQLLARGAHLDALVARGLEVRAPDETFAVRVEACAESASLVGCELAIVAVKTYALAEVAPAACLLARDGAVVLPLLNGIEAADRLVKAGVPRWAVLGGLTEIGATRIAPGVVERKTAFQRVVVGELSGGMSAKAEEVAAVFREAGVEARVSEDIATDLWRKLSFIASLAAVCGLARTAVGPIRSAPYGRLAMERAVAEALAVARRSGAAVGHEDQARILSLFDSLPDAAKPSFLVDLEAGRRTELDDLSGAVARLGRACGAETPVHDLAVAALSAGA
jgi:2-dehydropantoate 2-reductase